MSTEAVARLRALVAEKLGLRVEEDRIDAVLRAARAMAGTDGRRELTDLLDHLEGGPARGARPDLHEVFHRLGEALTVSETYFFRNPQQFDALVERALPERLRAGGTKPLRILSAGCATGEEAATVAMCLDRHFPALAPEDVEIVAVDVDRGVLAQARDGRYGRWALRQTPDAFRERYFRRHGPRWDLAPSIRDRIRFEARSIADPASDLWLPDRWDVIFCRNVFIYFTPEAMAAAVARFARSLRPGGWLFLGHTETLRGVSDAFELCQSHETFYYRLRGSAPPEPAPPFRLPPLPPASPAPAPPPSSPHPPSPPEPVPPEPDPIVWLDAIADATAKIGAAAKRSAGAASRRRPKTIPSFPRPTLQSPAVPGAVAAAEARPRDLASVLDLVRRERFEEALAALGALRPAGGAAEAEHGVVRAALLFQIGRTAAAEDECRDLLARDAFQAAAHYLLARCREEHDDPAAAAEHAVSAVYLEPGFALCHMLLGELSRRGGDAAAARRHFRRALDLLPSEDETRIVLFGGGFGRDALASLCEAALAPGRSP